MQQALEEACLRSASLLALGVRHLDGQAGLTASSPKGLSAWMWRRPDMEQFVGSVADGRVDHAEGTLTVPNGAGSKAEWP